MRKYSSKNVYFVAKNCHSEYTDLGSNPNSVLLGSKSQRFLKEKKKNNVCISCLQRVLISVNGRKLVLANHEWLKGLSKSPLL